MKTRSIRITPEIAHVLVQCCPLIAGTDTAADLRAIAAEPQVRKRGKVTIEYVRGPLGSEIL